MQIFYVPNLINDGYCLNEAESHHAIKVLRLQRGDKINLVDGQGSLFKAVIADVNPKSTRVSIDETIPEFEKRSYHLHIAISPLKNTDRFEWFLEKATEIGIDEITPLLCKRTEKKGFNMDRAKRIIESAMKQSIKAYCPQLNTPVISADFIQHNNTGIKLIACCEGERKLIGEVYKINEAVTLLIGPEGDFTPEEVELAVVNNFTPVTLGNSRLRTETAGVVACHSVYFINNTNH